MGLLVVLVIYVDGGGCLCKIKFGNLFIIRKVISCVF